MGFGTEILFFAALGSLLLGPKRLHTMIGHVTRAKGRFEEITQAFKSQFVEELDGEHLDRSKSSLSSERTT
jgi:Sec-independent protein translocase protein TatA